MTDRSIPLIRHGPVDLADAGMVTAQAFAAWAQRYEATGIGSRQPPAAALIAASQVARSFVSELPRSKESATVLGLHEPMSLALFNEPALPVPPISAIRLPCRLWLVASRALWLAGWNGRGETVAAARVRAHAAADRLVAAADGGVALVGHGWMNRLIGADLVKRGRRCSSHASAHWSLAKYRPPEVSVRARGVVSRGD